jgi:hypothetical protein
VGSPFRVIERDPVTTDRPFRTRDGIPSDANRKIYECHQTPAPVTVASSSRRTSLATPTEKDASLSIAPRATLAVQWEVRPSFSVSQNGDRAEVLYALQAYFGCGSIRPDRSDRTLKWETRRLDDLVGRVIPHFSRYPLLSGKRLDLERFAFVCWQMKQGAHRRVDGLVKIVRVASEMNPSGTRRYDASAILAKLLQGEGIVCASGNRGSTRSSDLHEWRNDLGAVSTRDPVKL